jgi:enolase
MDFQEFMVMPVGRRLSEACAGAGNFSHAQIVVEEARLQHCVGDEGGFAGCSPMKKRSNRARSDWRCRTKQANR